MGQTLSRSLDTDRYNSRNGSRNGPSAETKRKVHAFMESDYERIDVSRLQVLLSLVPMDENIFLVHYDNGFNLLQKCVAENNVEALKLLLLRNPDLNSYPCSLPLHIACLKGYNECVELLLRNGARPDIETRMCWPGPHHLSCRGVRHESEQFRMRTPDSQRVRDRHGRPVFQNALFYSLDGDQPRVLCHLMAMQDQERDTRVFFTRFIRFFCERIRNRNDRPVLEVACERQAWNCCNFLIETRSEEIRLCCLRSQVDSKNTNMARTTLFHVLFLMVERPATFILNACELFLEKGLRPDLNATDSVGNTPLHGLIVRYAVKKIKTGRALSYTPWEQKEIKLMVQFLLQNGARDSLNQPGNSALSYVIRHVNDWEFCYDLLDIMLRGGGNPNVKGKDGNFPLMVCLTPLINMDPFKNFTEVSKVLFMNCLRILCMHGANPNCVNLCKLTPLHILVFTASENLSLLHEETKSTNFAFIKNILIMLFDFGLDPNVGTLNDVPNIFYGVLDMLKNTRSVSDIQEVYELVLTLVQYGLNTNLKIYLPNLVSSYYGYGNPFLARARTYVFVYFFIILAKKDNILTDSNRTFSRVLHLFYYTMNHKDLNKCLQFLLIRQTLINPDSPVQRLYEIIVEMNRKPRTLKQMARATIHKLISRNPGLHVGMLPLAPGLRTYLRNFEP